MIKRKMHSVYISKSDLRGIAVLCWMSSEAREVYYLSSYY